MPIKAPADRWFCPAERVVRCQSFFRKFERKKDFTMLPHAALELRLAIEDILRHYLILAGFGTGKIKEAFPKLYRAGDLRRAILEVDPLIFIKTEFLEFTSSRGGITEVFDPKLDFICATYGQLGNLLHIQSRPHGRPLKWWTDHAGIVRQGLEHLKLLISKPLVNLSWDGCEGVLREYQVGKITKREVLERLPDWEVGQISASTVSIDLS